MVKTLCFHCRGTDSIPGQATNPDPHASQQHQKKKRLSSTCCGMCRVYTFGNRALASRSLLSGGTKPIKKIAT